MPKPKDGTENNGGATSTANDTFTPITSQEELDKAIGPRLERERSKFEGFDELKKKASQFDELEQANKTEIEKANDRVTKAEAEVAGIPVKVAEALREHLVKLHKIEGDDAELFLTANDPELLLKQVDRLTGRTAETAATKRRTGNNVSREGTNPPPPEDEDRDAVRGLFGGSDT